MFKYLVVVSSLIIIAEGQRWHTSQIMLTKLYDLQNNHFNVLDKYLELETNRLEELKNYVAAVYEWRDHIKTNKDFLHDHLDVIKMMTQMHQHFFKIDDLIKNKQSIEALKDIDEHKDLSGDHILRAHGALRRLQLFYAIPASEMSAGRMNEKVIGDRMDACECYVMAKYCLDGNDMYGVQDWAVEAYGKWESDGRPECVDPDTLNYYIVSSSVYTGFDFMNLINLSGSNYQEYTDKFARYYRLIKNELFELENDRATDVMEVYNYLEGKKIENEFRHLCKHGVSRTLTKYLKCRYQTNNLFYRILMPFKEEDINSEPLIKIYHDVLYDDEIMEIKTMSLPNMNDAKVRITSTDSAVLERSRSGQVYWINKFDAVKYFDALNTRIESFTGFSTKTAELYQIVNYGLGGHYLPHYDPFLNRDVNMKFGNRLVTVLFYLTGVQNDGYTSFPLLNIIVPTEKGAALVWINLHMSNGQLYYETLHGSCPLLKGNKLIVYDLNLYDSYNLRNLVLNVKKILVALYLIHFNLCHGDNWHYSLSSIYELFNLEVDNLIATETYIQNEYKRLENIRKFIEQRKKQNEKELAESYTESSINAFKTILRIKSDWETLKNKTAQTTAIGELKDKSVTYDNIVSGLKAIRRLQIIYELDAKEISNGNIVNDCYDMASLCYDNAEYHCAYWWFVEVHDRYKKDGNKLKTDFSTFVTKFAWSCYLVGDIDGAMYTLNEYFKETNDINDNIMNMRFTIWAGKTVFKRNTADDHDKKFYSYSLQKLDSEEEVSHFKTACRNTMNFKYSELKCRYYHGGRKYLMIGPLREEIVSLIPSMKLYRNVLYDDEIKKIKELANPKLERLSIDTNEDISLRKVTSFRKHNDQVFKTIHHRLAQISSKPTAEIVDKYVVTNYGVGGHYLPHTKYIDGDHLINSEKRDAIVIIHMDDVPAGGATVLPYVEAHVPSVKGSALVIYNTRNTFVEELLKFAQYGSCPIVYGDKWTLTMWLK